MTYCKENNVNYRINGELIRQLRLQRALSQYDLATDLCMQQCEISQLERGVGSKPRYDIVCIIADYFDKTFSELIIKEKCQ